MAHLAGMSQPKIYDDSDQLVKVLKKTLKPYKSPIKANTPRTQRFPFVALKKCSKLDKCVRDFCSNDCKVNESLDRKLKKICRKYCPSVDTRDSTEEQVKKKVKNVEPMIDLLDSQNEELDFEDGDEGLDDRPHPIKAQPKSLTNGFGHKSANSSNAYVNGAKDKTLSFFGSDKNRNQTFKIPKKISQNIETIISHANKLSKRPAEAYSHLNKHLTDDQWVREDVVQLLLTIAKNMVAFNEFGGHSSEFNQLINKLKTIKYKEEDFWDDLIFAVDKKRSDIKNSHLVNEFLANLYEYMTEYEINARVVCTEAVVIAYRMANNHSTVKDLFEL